MAQDETTFGSAIADEGEERLEPQGPCSKVLREDGDAISPQYLNDIEHDRRNPSSDRMVTKFAEALGLDPDWLYCLAGRFPADLRDKGLSQSEVTSLMVAFRGGPPRKSER